jgi:hypothetical protein
LANIGKEKLNNTKMNSKIANLAKSANNAKTPSV